MSLPTNVPAFALEACLIVAGLVLLWRLVLSPPARAAARGRTSPLAPWDIPYNEFFIFLWLVFCGAWALGMVTGLVCGSFGIVKTARLITINFASDGGMLLGIFIYERYFNRNGPRQLFADSSTLLAGAATFLIALPLVMLGGLVSVGLLTLSGLPIESQDTVRLFKETSSPAFLVAMVVFATMVAPLTEELVFRAGLFRYARTRLPRWGALVLPACFFAALHGHLPSFIQLVLLGVVFSLAYERTGRIGTAVVAHGLFNGYSVLRILLDPAAT